MAKLFSRITAAAAALCAALFGAGCSGNNPGANEPVDVYGPPDPEMFEAIYGPPEDLGYGIPATPEPEQDYSEGGEGSAVTTEK